MKSRIIFALFLAAVALAACSLTPRDTGEAHMFSLAPAIMTSGQKADVPLVVALPSAAPELDTARVALLRDQKVWDYYAGAKWADFLPVMVQDNFVKTLDSAGIFRKVGADDAGFGGKYMLRTEIRGFHADYTQGRAAPAIRLWMAASVVNRLDGKVLYSFELRQNRNAAADSLPAVQTAFRAAFLAAETDLVTRMRALPLPPETDTAAEKYPPAE